MKTLTLFIGLLLALNCVGQESADSIPHTSLFKRMMHRDYYVFNGHWSGFNFGFVNFGNTGYSDYSPETGEFMELDRANSFVMQLNFFEKSFNLVPKNNFGIILGLGLEYQRFSFENKNQSIARNEQGRIYPVYYPDLDTRRSTFKTLYLTVPVLFEQQFPAKWRKRFYVSAGVIGGVRMHSKTKVVYDDADGGKKKMKDSGSYSMIPVKADILAKVGYGNFNIWSSYTLTGMFKPGKGPEVHPYSIGLGISF